MNIFEAARIHPQMDRLYITRQERIKKDGSEYFTWAFPVTAAGVQSQIEIQKQFPRSGKYMPLDFIEVSNNDVVNLTLTINGADTIPVPAGTIRQIRGKALWQIGITNNDAALATTINMIVVSLRREPVTIDTWARGRS